MTHLRYLFILIPLLGISLFSCNNNSGDSQSLPKKNAAINESQPIALVIHGGAGTILKANMTPEKEKVYKEKLSEALNAGYGILENGGSSLEAITASIQILEASPLFNAGLGAVFTNEGTNELDASIMNGANGMAGAVAGVSKIKSPIMAALHVMQHSPHVMMAGKGAEAFAKEQGLEMVDSGYFFTEKRFEQLKRLQENELKKSNGQAYIKNMMPDKKYGTVGAVAVDKDGNIAAGTSTGGTTNKKYGRIGDSPIIGAGTYANNNTCGVSSTGHGEYFIRSVVAYDIAALMEYKGMTLQEASEEVIMKKLVAKKGSGGIIALDKKGNIAMPFNTPGMYRGYIKAKNDPKVFIYKE